MGLRFRKSINLGPIRLNFSKSGMGISFGTKGFRVSRSAKGKTQATVSLPGTGLSYVQDLDDLTKSDSETKSKKKTTKKKSSKKKKD